MLRKYRNALLNLVRESNLDPQRFNPIEEVIDGYDAFRLQVGDSPLYFFMRTAFIDDARKFDCQFSNYVRDHPKPNYPSSGISQWYSSFEKIEEDFKQWLDTAARKYLTDLAEEEEDRIVPDLWAELALPSGSSVDSQVIKNTPFSSDEQERIAETFNEFEKEIKSREILSEEQINLLHERVEYLVESSKRLGRKDWLAAAAGALIGFTFQAGLTSDTATQIIHLAGEALRWIAHTPLLLP